MAGGGSRSGRGGELGQEAALYKAANSYQVALPCLGSPVCHLLFLLCLAYVTQDKSPSSSARGMVAPSSED